MAVGPSSQGSRNLPWQFLCSQPLPFYSGTCLTLTPTSEARRGKYQQQAPGHRQADRTGKAANTAGRGLSYTLPHIFIQTCLQLFSRAFSPASHLLAASKPHSHYCQPYITLQKPAGSNSRGGICTRLQQCPQKPV